MQSDEDLEKLPKHSRPKNPNLPADRRARKRVLDEMKRDAPPMDAKQEAEYLDDLAERMKL